MLSPRLAFKQIREAVVGKQLLLRIHGNVVCVLADVSTTVKKCQMQAVTGKVNVAVRRHKIGSLSFRPNI